MAYLNVKERVIEAKIVYYGAGLSGKTTNLEQVQGLSRDGRSGEMMTLDTDGDRTLFFDWLPFNIGKFNGCDVKLQLYTVPGQAKYSETRRKVLASADGVVLVLDSQSGALEKNQSILADLREHMSSNDLKWGELPVVVQLNKRDLPSAMDPNELMAAVGIPELGFVEAVAARGEGVFETLREATRLVLVSVRDQARDRAPKLRTGESSGLDGNTMYTALTGEAGPAATAVSRPAPSAAPTPAPIPASPASTPTLAQNGVVRSTSPLQTNTGVAPSSSPRPGSPEPRAAAPSVNGAVPVPVPPASTVAAATQLGEVITAQRSLARKLDTVEASLTQSLAAGIAAMEKKLLARLVQVEERSAAVASAGPRFDALDANVAGTEQHLRGQLDEIRAELTRAVEAMADRQDQVSQAFAGLPARLELLLRATEERIAESSVARARAVEEGTHAAIERAGASMAASLEQAVAAQLAASEVARAEAGRATLAGLTGAVERANHALAETLGTRIEAQLAQGSAAALDAMRDIAGRLGSNEATQAQAHVVTRGVVEKSYRAVEEALAGRIEGRLAQASHASLDAIGGLAARFEMLGSTVGVGIQETQTQHTSVRSAIESIGGQIGDLEAAIRASAHSAQEGLTTLGKRLAERAALSDAGVQKTIQNVEERVQASLATQPKRGDIDTLRGALVKAVGDLRVTLATHEQLSEAEAAAERRHEELRAQQVTPSHVDAAMSEVRLHAESLGAAVGRAREVAMNAQAEARRVLDAVSASDQRQGERLKAVMDDVAAAHEAVGDRVRESLHGMRTTLAPLEEGLASVLRCVQETGAAVTQGVASTQTGLSETWTQAEGRFGAIDLQAREGMGLLRSVLSEMQAAKKSWWK